MEDKLQKKEIDASIKKQRMGWAEEMAKNKCKKCKLRARIHHGMRLSPRPSLGLRMLDQIHPYLSETFENFNDRMFCQKKIDAHPGQRNRFNGTACLKANRCHGIDTAGDDCTWKIWNLENHEKIINGDRGEGHKDWIAAIDFHPAYICRIAFDHRRW